MSFRSLIGTPRLGGPLLVAALPFGFAAQSCGHVTSEPEGEGAGGAPIVGPPVAGSSVAGSSVAGRAPAVAGAHSSGAGGVSGSGSAGTPGMAGASAGRAGSGNGQAGAAGRPGSSGSGGSAGTSSGNAGSPSAAGSGNPPPSMFGSAMHEGKGSSDNRYHKAGVKRNGVEYFFMANGWGPGFKSQSVSWNGTSFTVASMEGVQGDGYEPASYPTVFCGTYSDSRSGPCGLPKPLTEISSLRTGWRWRPNGNTGQYNAAYDVWLSTSNAIQGHSSFLMMWLRDPPGQQPAGRREHTAVTVANTPGTWDIWVGTVGGKPCISYVRAEGQDTLELEFDVMDFVRDVSMRQIEMPGSQVLSVAVGFEIWNGPVRDLISEDFYVDAR